METITVVFSEEGDVKVSTAGFAGASCLKATADLEKALGSTTSDRKTSEYLKRESTANTLKQGSR